MFLYYKDLGDNSAISMEKEADRIIEKEILTKIPWDVSQEEARIYILPWCDTYRCHGIQVRTNSGIVTIHIQRNGKEKMLPASYRKQKIKKVFKM